MQERLQKIISASGLMSRRAAEECIKVGRVSVNGVAAALGMSADTETDNILVDGRPLPTAGEKLYIMLNKPKGYVTTLHDEKDRRCVTELLSGLHARVYPVGRLDMYSEGLLICTNDGEFANRLMHPSREAVEYLRYPMEIDGYMTRGAEVDIISLLPGGAELAITIHEGRNRQVRKMCAAVGLRVTKLRRVREGSVELGDLPAGKWRSLTAEEIASFDR